MLANMRHTGGTTRDTPVVANRRRPIWVAPICPARIASGWKESTSPASSHRLSLLHVQLESMQSPSPRTQLQPSSVIFRPCVSYTSAILTTPTQNNTYPEPYLSGPHPFKKPAEAYMQNHNPTTSPTAKEKIEIYSQFSLPIWPRAVAP